MPHQVDEKGPHAVAEFIRHDIEAGRADYSILEGEADEDERGKEAAPPVQAALRGGFSFSGPARLAPLGFVCTNRTSVVRWPPSSWKEHHMQDDDFDLEDGMDGIPDEDLEIRELAELNIAREETALQDQVNGIRRED